MPKATTARTTRTERMPYRKSRSRRLDTGRSGLLLVIPSRSSLGRREDAPEWPDELGEFERQDEFRRGASAERLESVQVLQHQRLLVELRTEDRVDLLALREDLVQDDVADDGSEGRRRDAHRGSLKIVHSNDGVRGAGDFEVHDEVDIHRGVVFCDTRLVRNRQVTF